MSWIIHYEFCEYTLPIVFLRDVYKGTLSVQDFAEEHCKLFSKLNIT